MHSHNIHILDLSKNYCLSLHTTFHSDNNVPGVSTTTGDEVKSLEILSSFL